MPEKLVDQPSAKPTRKVLFGTIAGVVGYALMVAAAQVWGPELPDEIAQAIPVLAALATSYVVRDREQ
jgi:putative flippase GtrA